MEIKQASKAMKANPEAAAAVLKGAVSSKMLSRMKKEYVTCPVVNADVPFLDCFACVSFIRRVKGVVHCAGLEKKLRA
ncbi:MAG: hypothetical protein NXY59_07505 [Aigarchaeota archaeon]|nr:hypothetical protein [Candidatus Pelearchaeum maunauluense]